MKKMRRTLLITFATLALTLVASAAMKKSIKIQLYEDTNVAGTPLKAGEYRVHVNDNTATFQRDGKDVATVAVHDAPAQTKFDNNEIVTDASHGLMQINIGGSTDSLVVDGLAK